MSPLMHAVVEAGQAGLARKARPWEISSEDFFTQTEELRRLSARLFQCTANDVSLVPSAGYGIETAARNLPVGRGQKILVLAEQFPSNVYPWRRVARENGAEVVAVGWPEDGDWTSAVMRHLSDDVAIAALPHTQWTSRGLLNLERIGVECRRNGTALALHLTQSLGALPFDAGKVQPDFAVAAAYKWLLSPYSTGVLYVAPKWQVAGLDVPVHIGHVIEGQDVHALAEVGVEGAGVGIDVDVQVGVAAERLVEGDVVGVSAGDELDADTRRVGAEGSSSQE